MPEHIHDRMLGDLTALDKANKRRHLPKPGSGADFYSNDYLGLADRRQETPDPLPAGAGGSRLISGNHDQYTLTEAFLANAHQVEAVLIYPSGFMANMGLLSCLAKKGDLILYDALCHASIRDGLRLSPARHLKFKHNDLNALETKLAAAQGQQVFVVTESVFSMDGDEAPLVEMLDLCDRYNAHLIVDEAHAIGYFGLGKVHSLHLQERVLATVITFSKGLGLHGGAILGSATLRDYLINFSRPLIYTTGLPPHAVAEIRTAYRYLLEHGPERRQQLTCNIDLFNRLASVRLKNNILPSNTPIQAILIPGNAPCRAAEQALRKEGLLAKAILHPTVPAGTERIRVILHAFNTQAEIKRLINTLEICLA